MNLLDFIDRHCIKSPGYRVKATELFRAYRAASAEPRPIRSVLIAELTRGGYSIGADVRGQTWIVGVALETTKVWVVDPAGRVRREPVAA